MDAFLASVITSEQAKAYASDGFVTEVAPSGNQWMIQPRWSAGATVVFNRQRLLRNIGASYRRVCVHIETDQCLPGCYCIRCKSNYGKQAILVPDMNIAIIILYLRAGMEDYVLKTAKDA